MVFKTHVLTQYSNEGQLALEVPFMGVTLPNTVFDWNYTTTPQDGLNNRTFHYTRGHVLGGSSSISKHDSFCFFGDVFYNLG